jgi:hypothetical protein
MKKLFAAMALVAASSAFAGGSATIDYQNADGVNGGTDQTGYSATLRQDVNKNFTGDVAFQTRTNDSTGNLSTQRLEAGITGKLPLGPVTPTLRLGTGEKFASTYHYAYYVVEPGVNAPIGSTGLTARLAWRYRAAWDTANLDETRTWRYGLSYAINKEHAVNLRYDVQRGQSNQNVMAVGYTRSF